LSADQQITVIQGNRCEIYSLNDGISNVQDALDKFGVDGSITFTVSGRTVSAGAPLREGDVILVLSAATASGGMKGA
jgi:hypothetical protein